MDAPLYDCFSTLHMHIPVGAEACAAARATIRAAEIQAKATRSAGGESLVAGILAFVAGVLAFAAAFLEAYRLRKTHKLHNRSYSLKLLMLLRRAHVEMERVAAYLRQAQVTSKICMGGTWPVGDFELTYLDALRSALKFERWSEVANLPQRAIGFTVTIDEGVNGAINDFVKVLNIIQEEKNLLAKGDELSISEMTRGRYIVDCLSTRRLIELDKTMEAVGIVQKSISATYPVECE